MSRQLPRIQTRELLARAVFEPNGEAVLEVSTPRVDASFSRDEVTALKAKIEAFERAATFEDGRPFDRLHRHREAL